MNLRLKAGRLAAVMFGASVALLLGAASCGDSVLPGTPDGQPATAPVGGPIPAGLTDPCALLSASELSEIGGAPVADGERNPDEDGSFVACHWYAEDDDLRIAGVVDLTLLVLNDEMKANVESDIISGKGERLVGVGQSTTVQAADLGVAGNSYAAGWQGVAFYRLSCTTPVGAVRPSKQICIDAVTLIADRLPAG